MTIRKKWLIGVVALLPFILLLPAPLMAESFLGDEEVKYRGDRLGVQVCRAIVSDDTDALIALLQHARRSIHDRWYGIYTTSRSTDGTVTCNGQDLIAFADSIGAANVTRYLSGRVTIEELATTGK